MARIGKPTSFFITTKQHVALAIRKRLLQFDWNILSYPPYSSNLALSNYYLFLSLKNFLHDKWFQYSVRTHFEKYFVNKSQ